MSPVSHADPVTYNTYTNLRSIRHHFRTVAGVEMFYREAGDRNAPVIVLLSSHPSGVHAYNGLIERLAASWHVVAPDYPGYGFSTTPADAPWTFDWLADISNDFLEQLGLDRYVMYMFGEKRFLRSI